MAVQEERCQCRQKGVPKTILAGWPGSAQLARETAARRRRAVRPRRSCETRIASQPPGGGLPPGREVGRFLAWLSPGEASPGAAIRLRLDSSALRRGLRCRFALVLGVRLKHEIAYTFLCARI